MVDGRQIMRSGSGSAQDGEVRRPENEVESQEKREARRGIAENCSRMATASAGCGFASNEVSCSGWRDWSAKELLKSFKLA